MGGAQEDDQRMFSHSDTDAIYPLRMENKHLTRRESVLVALAAQTATGHLADLEELIIEATRAGATAQEIREVLSLIGVYCGLPLENEVLSIMSAVIPIAPPSDT